MIGEIIAEREASMAAARRQIEVIEFQSALSADFVGQQAQEALEQEYRLRGRLVAQVLDMCEVEIPDCTGDKKSRFLLGINEHEHQRVAQAADIFSQARNLSIRTSRLPWRNVAFDGISRVATGYRTMHSRLRPPMFTTPELRQVYEQGFMERAEELQIDVPNLATGVLSIKEAPKKIRGIQLDEVAGEIDEQNPPILRFLTEHGAILGLDWRRDTGFGLVRTVQSLKGETRIEHARAPSVEEFPEIVGRIVGNIGLQATVHF